MTFSVGQRLREARQTQELELKTVVARTKISERNLRAIEADDRASFPSAFFYRSFVEQYARALSLDPKEILEEIDGVLATEAPLPLPGQNGETNQRVPPLLYGSRSSHGRLYASLLLLIIALAACSGFYALWRDAKTRPLSLAALVPKFLAPQRQAEHPKVQPPIPLPAPTANPEPVQATPAAAAPAASTAATQAALATNPPPPQLSPDYKLLLDLLAREETWLSVSSDGRQVFAGVLAPNQSKSIAGKEFAKMRVGNAAGLEVRLNGKPIGPLGGRGQVLVVLFTPDKFQIVPPVKESD